MMKRYLKTCMSFCLCVVPSPSWAAGFPDVWQDPLLVLPPVLAEGAQLPGDASPPSCPVKSEVSPLTLGLAVDMALCNSPRTSVTWAGIKSQAAVLGEARAAYLPTLNATVSRLRTHTWYPDGVYPDMVSNGRSIYGALSWRLLDSGTRSANLEAAEESLKAALASHDAELQRLLISVVAAYFDVMTADAAHQARMEISELAQATLESTQRRERRGVAAKSDVLQAETAWAKARLAMNRAKGDAIKARSVLAYTIGLPAALPLTLPSGTSTAETDRVRDLEQWLAEAQTGHPAIVSARAQLAASKAKVDVVRAEGLPTLDFTDN